MQLEHLSSCQHKRVPNMAITQSNRNGLLLIVQESYCVTGAFHRMSTNLYSHRFHHFPWFRRTSLFRHNTSWYKHPIDYCPTAFVSHSVVLRPHVWMVTYNKHHWYIHSTRANRHLLFNTNDFVICITLSRSEYAFTFGSHKSCPTHDTSILE